MPYLFRQWFLTLLIWTLSCKLSYFRKIACRVENRIFNFSAFCLSVKSVEFFHKISWYFQIITLMTYDQQNFFLYLFHCMNIIDKDGSKKTKNIFRAEKYPRCRPRISVEDNWFTPQPLLPFFEMNWTFHWR